MILQIITHVQQVDLTKQAGQGIIVFTRDQHLYRVAVNISWAQPDIFQLWYNSLVEYTSS